MPPHFINFWQLLLTFFSQKQVAFKFFHYSWFEKKSFNEAMRLELLKPLNVRFLSLSLFKCVLTYILYLKGRITEKRGNIEWEGESEIRRPQREEREIFLCIFVNWYNFIFKYIYIQNEKHFIISNLSCCRSVVILPTHLTPFFLSLIFISSLFYNHCSLIMSLLNCDDYYLLLNCFNLWSVKPLIIK